jgi:hypothetical protein
MAERRPLTLDHALSLVRARLGYLKPTSVVTKQGTKERFVEPILAALGWNLLLAGETQRDYGIGGCDRLIDYVLVASNIRRVFVVVRALHCPVENEQELKAAASAAGARWLILTDGDAYAMYDMHERRRRRINVHDRNSIVPASLARIAKEQVLRDDAVVVPRPLDKRLTFTPQREPRGRPLPRHSSAPRYTGGGVASQVRYCVRCQTTYLASHDEMGCPGCT